MLRPQIPMYRVAVCHIELLSCVMNVTRVGALDEFAQKKFQRCVMDLAIRWTLDQRGVTVVLQGARHREQVVTNLDGWTWAWRIVTTWQRSCMNLYRPRGSLSSWHPLLETWRRLPQNLPQVLHFQPINEIGGAR
jgi:hypothetical protein